VNVFNDNFLIPESLKKIFPLLYGIENFF